MDSVMFFRFAALSCQSEAEVDENVSTYLLINRNVY